MKKLLALLIAFAMIFTLAACSSDTPNTSSNAPDPGTSTSTPSEPDDTPSEPAETPVTLIFANSYQVTEVGGEVATYFAEKIAELSGGSIEVDYYPGATYCAQPEEWEYLKNGTIDLVCQTPVFILSSVPEAFGLSFTGSLQEVTDQEAEIFFENEVTSKIIADAGAAENYKFLGVTCGGNNFLGSTVDVKSLDDVIAKGLKLGSPINHDAYNALGVSVVSADPGAMYDSLSRGVFDCVMFAAAAYASQNLHEVGPYGCITNVVNTSCVLAINLELWNTLSENQQRVLQEAADATVAYSVERYAYHEAQLNDLMTVTTWSMEDANAFAKELFEGYKGTVRASAANLGRSEGMETIISTIAEAAGYDPS